VVQTLVEMQTGSELMITDPVKLKVVQEKAKKEDPAHACLNNADYTKYGMHSPEYLKYLVLIGS
jgi:hypothetical protein